VTPTPRLLNSIKPHRARIRLSILPSFLTIAGGVSLPLGIGVFCRSASPSAILRQRPDELCHQQD